MLARWQVILAICLCSLSMGRVYGRLAATPFMPDYFESSDIVCKGVVVSIGEIGENPSGGVSQDTVSIAFTIISILKGELAHNRIEVLAAKNPYCSASGVLPQGRTFLLFLKREAGRLTFWNYDPYGIPASPEKVEYPQIATPTERLELELVASLQASEKDAKLAAISGIGDMRFYDLLGQLRELETSQDAEVTWRALVARIAMGDTQALEAFVSWYRGAAGDYRQEAELKLYRDVLSRSKSRALSKDLVPGLKKLTGVESRLLRLGAIYSLKHLDAQGSLETFIDVLDQSDDLDTKYQCVLGLALGSGNLAHVPAFDVFKMNPEKYVAYWMKWSGKKENEELPEDITGAEGMAKTEQLTPGTVEAGKIEPTSMHDPGTGTAGKIPYAASENPTGEGFTFSATWSIVAMIAVFSLGILVAMLVYFKVRMGRR